MIFNRLQKTLFAKRFKNRFRVIVFFVGDATRIHFLFESIQLYDHNRTVNDDRIVRSRQNRTISITRKSYWLHFSTKSLEWNKMIKGWVMLFEFRRKLIEFIQDNDLIFIIGSELKTINVSRTHFQYCFTIQGESQPSPRVTLFYSVLMTRKYDFTPTWFGLTW